jgi:hypothetical protein
MAVLFFFLAVAVAAACGGRRRLALGLTLAVMLTGLAMFLYHFKLPPDIHL